MKCSPADQWAGLKEDAAHNPLCAIDLPELHGAEIWAHYVLHANRRFHTPIDHGDRLWTSREGYGRCHGLVFDGASE